jgi:hypothetical protein
MNKDHEEEQNQLLMGVLAGTTALQGVGYGVLR